MVDYVEKYDIFVETASAYIIREKLNLASFKGQELTSSPHHTPFQIVIYKRGRNDCLYDVGLISNRAMKVPVDIGATNTFTWP